MQPILVVATTTSDLLTSVAEMKMADGQANQDQVMDVLIRKVGMEDHINIVKLFQVSLCTKLVDKCEGTLMFLCMPLYWKARED